MVSGGLVERVEQTYRCSKLMKVLSGQIRCSRTTNLQAEVIDNIGICAYHPRKGVAYLANLLTCISDDKNEWAHRTIEPLIKRLRKDHVVPSALSVVVFGDSIQSYEYARNTRGDDGNSLHVRRVHAAYRDSILDSLYHNGIGPGRCTPLFADEEDTYVEVMLYMPNACMGIQEVCQSKSRSFSPKQFSLRF